VSRENEIRTEAVNRVLASLPYLESAPLHDVARELVVQGLDLVERSDRAGVVAEAEAELDEEGQ